MNDWKIITNDPFFDKINLEEINERGKPRRYLLHAIDMFKQCTDSKVILEVGSICKRMDHSIDEFDFDCCKDGHSTYFWSYYTEPKTSIYSVDINPECKSIIDKDERLSKVVSETCDPFEYIRDFKEKIDLLFLDLWDVKPDTLYAENHLLAYQIVKDKLASKCLLLIDDTDIGYSGKLRLLIPEIKADGFIRIFHGRQALFYRNVND